MGMTDGRRLIDQLWDTPPARVSFFGSYDPHLHGGSDPAEVPEPAERSRMVDGTEYMTVSEYVRRIDPVLYPSSPDLISASGYDRTYVQLGKMAADRGRLMGVQPVKMYHPEYEAVNGWPEKILKDAWGAFKLRYQIQWLERDPEPPVVPEPVQMPPSPINQRLMAQVRMAAERRGVSWAPSRDPRWRGALAVMLEERPGETPEQAMVRRTSAAGAMFAIEKEYQGQ